MTPAERQLLAIRAFDTLRAAEPAAYVAELTDRASVNLPTFSHGLFPLHYTVAQSLLYLDRLDDADALCDRLMRETAGQGMTLMASSLLVYRAGIALCRGDIDHAAAAARAAHERARSDGELPFRTALDAIMIDVHIERGDLTAADRVASAHTAGDPADVSWEWPRFLMSLASLRTAQGDSRAGLSLVMQSGRHWEAAGTVNPAFGPWRSRAARALLTMGAPADAHALIERELDLARRRDPAASVWPCVPRAWPPEEGGAWSNWPRRSGCSTTHRRTSNSPAPFTRTGARCSHGRKEGRADRPAARTGRRGPLGRRTAGERLQKRLHDAGGRGSYRPAKDASPLTAGEERVVSMAVQGLSSREDARPRTSRVPAHSGDPSDRRIPQDCASRDAPNSRAPWATSRHVAVIRRSRPSGTVPGSTVAGAPVRRSADPPVAGPPVRRSPVRRSAGRGGRCVGSPVASAPVRRSPVRRRRSPVRRCAGRRSPVAGAPGTAARAGNCGRPPLPRRHVTGKAGPLVPVWEPSLSTAPLRKGGCETGVPRGSPRPPRGAGGPTRVRSLGDAQLPRAARTVKRTEG